MNGRSRTDSSFRARSLGCCAGALGATIGDFARAGYRFHYHPDSVTSTIGFRVVRSSPITGH
jgi:formylglycine-generating enzyme required for sulfatase activity